MKTAIAGVESSAERSLIDELRAPESWLCGSVDYRASSGVELDYGYIAD
jgi:hypothetical protein